MEFWGVEVKAGVPVKVKLGVHEMIHLSQSAVGEVKNDKGNELIFLFLSIIGQKHVIGTLSPGKIPQISHDLVLTGDFELSHNWKNGSIYLSGYKSVTLEKMDDDTDSDFGEELPVIKKENAKPEPKTDKSDISTAKASAAKPKVTIVEPNKARNSKEDDDEDSDDDSDDDDDSEYESEEGPMDVSREDSSDEDNESDEEDESSSEEDEETPKKADKGKKRPAESGTKTPVPEKKTKLVTPQKSGDGKKGGVHIATPHPSKKAGKTPANNDKSKQQTPKSAGQVVCKSCSKTFNSDNALQSHTKAKHADGK